MQRCPYCQAQQLNGTIFCSECGASLLGNEHRRETTAALNRAAASGSPTAFEMAESEAVVIDAPASPQSGRQATLVVINSGRRIVLDRVDHLLLGRKDNKRGIYPDVDLGLDGGYEAGVSRRHALISIQNGAYYIEDLASANGTFVNGQRLPPQQAVPIRHGDEVKLGTLILRFEVG